MSAKNTVLYMVARFAPAVVTMFTVFFYTNNVDPDQYGLFSKLAAVASIFYPMLFAPIWYYILRYKMEQGARILSRSYTVFWIVVAFSLFICIVIKILFDVPEVNDFVAVILMIVLFGNIQIRLEQVRIESKPNKYLLIASTRSLLVLIISFIFIKNNIYFLTSPIVDSTLIGIFLCVLPYDLKSIHLVDIQDALNSFKTIYKFGFFLALYSVFNTALFSIDRVLIGYINGNHVSGLYSSPYDLANKLVHTIVFALDLSMLPALLRIKSDGGNLADQFTKNTKTFIFVMLPIVIGLLCISPAVCEVYFPDSYREAATFVFPIIVLSTFVGGFSNAIYHHSYILTDKNYLLFKNIGIVLCFNIGANFIFNLIGAPFYSAYVSLASFALYGILTYLYTKKCFGYKFPLGFVGMVIGICSPMIVFAISVGFSKDIKYLVSEILISIIYYFFAIYALNVYGIRYMLNRKFMKPLSL